MNAPTLLGTANSSGSATSYATGTCTPTSSTGYEWFAVVQSRRSGGAQLAGVTGMGLMWEPLRLIAHSTPDWAVTLYRGYPTQASGASAGAVTATFPGSQLACSMQVFQTDPAEVVQIVSEFDGGTSNPSVTLASFADPSNALTIYSCGVASTVTQTPDGSLTELSEINNSEPMGLGLHYLVGEDTTPSCTLSAASAGFQIGVELTEPSAAAPVVLVSHSDSNTATSYTTSVSVTPTVNESYCMVSNTHSTSASNVPTLSGGGVTWTEVDTETETTGTNRTRITLFRATAGTPSSGALTADFSGESQLDCNIVAIDFPETTSVVQTASNVTAGATSLSVTLSSFASASNTTALFIAKIANDGDQPVFDGLRYGATMDLSGSGSRPGGIGYKIGEDTSPSASWGTSTSAVAIAVEIQSAGAEGTIAGALGDTITADLAGQFLRTGTIDGVLGDTIESQLAGSVSLQAVIDADLGDTITGSLTGQRAVQGTIAATVDDLVASQTGLTGTVVTVDVRPFVYYHYYRTPDGFLALVESTRRLRQGGWNIPTELHERVTERFRVNIAVPRSLIEFWVQAAWAANSGESAATLQTALHAALSGQGVKRFDGSSL